jgi:hypothetical protein
MTSVVPTQTAELGRRWLTATVGAAAVAATIPVVAGGPGMWLHIAMAIITIVGFTLAALHRRTFEIPVIVALLSVMTVGDTATIDRAVVALPTAIAVLVAIECAVITRRLDSAAPVSSTGHAQPRSRPSWRGRWSLVGSSSWSPSSTRSVCGRSPSGAQSRSPSSP